MSDLLSSASLILAVVGILYGLWYPEIMKVLEKNIPKHIADRGEVYRDISSTFFTRSLPLTLLAITVSLIFLRDTMEIIVEQYSQLTADGLSKYIAEYDTVSIAFCAVEILTISIGLHVAVLMVKLIVKRSHPI